MTAARLPLVISVPHGGMDVPLGYKDICLLSAADILEDGDPWSGNLYDFRGHVASFVDTDVARAVIDINRHPDDRPPANPDGVVKTVTVRGKQIWAAREGLPPKKIEELISKYHKPYHEKLRNAAVQKGLILGVDCHTMLACDPVSSLPRPTVCLSNGGNFKGEQQGKPVTAAASLLLSFKDTLEKAFVHEDFTVLINDPFKGGYISMYHGLQGALPWLQLELNRDLYLPREKKLPVYPDDFIRRRLQDLRGKLLKALRNLCS